MATKPKSRVSKQNNTQLTQFKFRWWMALILVAVIAAIGVIIVRFSHAGGVTYPDYVVNTGCFGGPGASYCGMQMRSSGSWTISSQFPFGIRINGNNTITCATMTSQGYKNQNLMGHVVVGQQIDISEYKTVPKTSNNYYDYFVACR